MAKMRVILEKLTFFSLISFLLAMCACSRESPADLILLARHIYTMDGSKPEVRAVAIRGKRIVLTGSAREVLRLKGKQTLVLDLKDDTVLPGLIDAHCHVLGLGRYLAELRLEGTSSPKQIADMVIEKQRMMPKGAWISGRGWDQNEWKIKQFPTWRDLKGSEENPVYLRRVDGHAAWVNEKALELCEISKSTPDPPGGRIIRDDQGNPTGVFIDKAADLISDRMPVPSYTEKLKFVRTAIRECNRLGLTGVHDAGVDSVTLDIYRELFSKGELTLRIYAMLDGEEQRLLDSYFAQGPVEEADHHLTIRSVKLYADGALGSRGAALLEPYSDDPGQKGLLVRPEAELCRITDDALAHGYQVCTHAIGDAANRIVLNIYERALKEDPVQDARLRIEHAQVVSPDDMPRFAALGVIPSMQPGHATSDMDWAEARLGPERIKGAYAWRKFLDEGCRIPCGSDFPVESANPLWGIYAAVTRQDHAGRPAGGWYPEERMTIVEALRGYTLDAAYAEFAEKLKGSITAGKLADIVVLDRNVLKEPPEALLKARVVYTIVGGIIVYENKELQR
jgi:predicted amidohydrolase YtcJ